MASATKLGQILLQSGVIDEFQLQAAVSEHERCGHRLGVTLVRLGFLEEASLVRALAAQLSLPIARLDRKRVDAEILELVPRDVAEKHLVLPLFVKNHEGRPALFLGMEDPCDNEAMADAAAHSGLPVHPVLVAASEIAIAIDRLYRETLDTQHLPRLVPTALSTPATPVASAATGSAASRLRALEELLVERGVLDFDELEARVARNAARGDAASKND